MNTYRLLLNSVSDQWLLSMETVLNERTSWDVITNQSTIPTDEVVERLQPDILVWKMESDYSCLDLARLKNVCPAVIPVIIVNDFQEVNINQFFQYGACGCLPSRLRPRQVVGAIELIAAAGISCFPGFAPHQGLRKEERLLPGSTKLTGREREILSLLCQNNSNQEIAQMLSVSESTVKTHLHNIYRKMGKRKRGEVLAAVYNSR